jgi:hypothetical protein
LLSVSVNLKGDAYAWFLAIQRAFDVPQDQEQHHCHHHGEQLEKNSYKPLIYDNELKKALLQELAIAYCLILRNYAIAISGDK